MVLDGSGISPEVAAERGYRTVGRSGVPESFKRYQRRSGLLIPMYSPDGATVGHQLRPDVPRVRDSKRVKYETPGGARCIIDVHPRMRDAAGDAGVDLWITEGIKKADALTSRGLCTVGLIGVWNWQKDGELLPDFGHVALADRDVYVVFDSDVMVKPEVELALERLTGALEARGATVRVVYLPDAEDGSKVGADDYLVAGGTVGALYELARPFERSDYAEARLTRDGRLRAAVGALWRIHDAMPARRNADYTRRIVFRALIEEAERRGRPVGDGVSFYMAGNDGALRAGTSQPTFSKHVRAMETGGYLRVERPTDPAKANVYVLLTGGRAVGNINGRRVPLGGNESLEVRGEENASAQVYDRRYSQPRALEDVPALRWSRTVMSWVFVDGVRVCEADHLARLGKRRGAIIEHVLDAGGSAPVAELMETFAGGSTRRRDFERRVLGMLTGLDGGPVVLAIDGDEVSLVDGWREALENARELGMEQEAHERQAVNYELKKVAFRSRHEVKPERAPTEEEMRRRREAREARKQSREEPQRPVSDLAAAIREYLDRSPGDADQPAGWLGNTVWTFDLYPGKHPPTPQESGAAVEELGGDEYRRLLLSRSRSRGVAA